MPVFSVKVDRRYDGQQCLSEYHYVGTGTPAAVTMSFALAKAFGLIESAGVYDPASIFGSLLAFQNPGVSYIEFIVKNLYSATDFYTSPFVTGLVGLGGGSGDRMSAFYAAEIRSNRVRSDIRRGFKRYEGLIEGNVTAYGDLEVGFRNAVASHAAALSTTLHYTDEGNSLTFVPCVLQLKKNTTDPSKGPYIKWPTEAEQLDHVAQGVVYATNAQATTQNSRKRGRGS